MSHDEFDYWFDRYDEREAAEFAALMGQENPVPPVTLVTERCRGCGYRLGSAGHRAVCGQPVSERAA